MSDTPTTEPTEPKPTDTPPAPDVQVNQPDGDVNVTTPTPDTTERDGAEKSDTAETTTRSDG